MSDLTVDAHLRLPAFELDVSFVAAPGIVVLFGPTASGKTLTLRLIAGLERAASGTVRFAETMFDDSAAAFVPAERRGLGAAHQRQRARRRIGVDALGGVAERVRADVCPGPSPAPACPRKPGTLPT